MEHNPLEKCGKAIVFIDLNGASRMVTELLDCVDATTELLIGVDVGIIKISGDIVAL